MKKRAAGDAEPGEEQRPWAVLAMDVETHGWCDGVQPQPRHRGQFGKFRWGNVSGNLDFSRMVQLGWCVFATNGDVIARRELCISDAPPCQQRAVEFHGLTDEMLASRGVPLIEGLRQLAAALRRLQSDGGLLVAHPIEFDAALVHREYMRVGATDDAALLATLAAAGVCTMQAAAAQQRVAVRPARTEEQLRNSFNFNLWAITLAAACRMYGVAMPAESDGYRPHAALYDAELAGRLYFAMRGIAYATAAARPALFVRRR